MDEHSPQVNSSEEAFYIVGIGASAGGLDALERFFRNVPAEAPIAFVIVQHLSPDFKSLMNELLARQTNLPIFRAEHNMQVQPGNIYLNPPRTNMVISKGRLRLTDIDPEEALSLPIDVFLQSLANDWGPKSVAVILSGTGSDGSRGVQQVHAAGGLVVVQNLYSSGFDGMPRSALATGLADIIVAPEQMPSKILEYIENSGILQRPVDDSDDIVTEEGELSLLFSMLRKEFQIDFNYYKPSTILRRLEKRVMLTRSADLKEYLDRLSTNPPEMKFLHRDLLVEVTQFFRDPEVFQIFNDNALIAQIIDNASPEGVRIWVPGCATGEEAYSFAMLFQEELEKRNSPVDVRIFATDVHQGSLLTASNGLYDGESIKNVPETLRDRYFTRTAKGFQISKKVRQMVVFAVQNLTHDPPFTKLDIVSCRNVLIYFKNQVQQKIMSNFFFGLRKDGILLLGSSEQIGELAGEFETIDRRWRVYRKRHSKRLPVSTLLSSPPRLYNRIPVAESRDRSRFDTALYDALLDNFMPPGFLINSKYELIYIFGGANQYLQLPVGRGSLNIIDLMQGNLRTATRAALHRASKQDESVEYTNLRFQSASSPESAQKSVRLRVMPLLSKGGSEAPHYMVSISESTALSAAAEERPVTLSDESQGYVEKLEHELKYLEEQLQTTIEELESANEELQSTNEELLASNEELQSANEELHSVNEELYTVNSEYQHKISELTQLTSDLKNLQQSSEIGTIFLDSNLCIREFTHAAQHIFNLLPQDAGRPLDHLLYNIRLPRNEMMEFVEKSLAGQSTEQEIYTLEGDSLLMRVLPYRTEDGEINGIVLTFIESAFIRQLGESLHHESERRQRYFDLVEMLLLELSPSGEILAVNQNTCATLGYVEEELLGTKWKEYAHAPATEEGGQPFWERLLAGGMLEFESTIHNLQTRSGDVRTVMWRFAPLRPSDGTPSLLICAGLDITEATRMECELQESRNLLQRVFTQTPAYVAMTSGPDHTFVLANPLYQQLVGGRDVIGKPLAEALPEMTEESTGFVEEAYRTGETYIGSERPWVIRSPNTGEPQEHSLNVVVEPLRDSGNVVDGLLIFAIDVTERVESRRKLRRRRQELQSIIDHTDAIIYIKDLEGRYTSFSNEWLRHTELQREEATGLTDYDLFPKEQADVLRTNDQAIIVAKEKLPPFEETLLLNGQEQIFSSVKFPLFDSQGEVYAVAGVSTNISAQKVQEQHTKDLESEVAQLRARVAELEQQ